MAMTALDYEEIRQVLARYDRAIDFGDADAFAACFTPDGFLEVTGLPSDAAHEGRRYAGHPALRTFAAELYAGLQGHVRHCNNLPVIEGDGQRATMFSYLFEFRVGVLPRVGVTMTGVYEDTLAKVDWPVAVHGAPLPGRPAAGASRPGAQRHPGHAVRHGPRRLSAPSATGVVAGRAARGGRSAWRDGRGPHPARSPGPRARRAWCALGSPHGS